MSVSGLGRYPVTTGLLVVNIIVFILQQIPSLNVTYWGVNWGPLTLSGEYWRFFTPAYLHDGIFHIALNMWCLFSLGQLSERLFGKWQTFMIYNLTGVGGALLSIASNPTRSELGASGAIFGLAGALIAGIKFGDLNISAGEKRALFSSVLSFAIYNFLFGGALNFVGGRIDNMCHLGGLVTGLLLGLPLGAFVRNKALQLATVVITSGVLFAAGRELVQTRGPEAEKSLAKMAGEQGAYGMQSELLEKYTHTNPGDEQALLDLGTAYARIGELDKAVAAFQHVLALNPNSAEAKQALEELRSSAQPEEKK
jgi:rhomboid protease GluP